MPLQDLYAAVWEKTGGPAWAARHGMSAVAYQQAFDQFAKQGYRLRNVSGCGLSGHDLYCRGVGESRRARPGRRATA